ncbi:MAG: ComEC family competence protein, partial [Bacteroidia bacterium]|nr:ComEC family competence protein [Bacteroidia bacterium]
MKKTVQKVPFLRLIIALTTGIAAGSLVDIPVQLLFLLMLLALAAIILIDKNYRYSLSPFFGMGVHFLFALVGMFTFLQYNKKPVFYNNGQFAATVLETPQEKPNSFQTIIRITSFSDDSIWQKIDEKIIVYFGKDEKAKSLKPGENILFKQNPEWIKNNGNPYEFDYKKYLQRKKIYRQLYLQPAHWDRTAQKPIITPEILAEQTREKLLTIYRRQNLGEEQFKILSALTLGYKRELNAEIKQTFSASGAMHVLAVSGLHVGIIFIALTFLFGFLKKKTAGRILYVGLIIFMLWLYAFITGLSPSVERAATMFTFVVAGNSLKRQVSIYNSLAASAFFLLLVNPNNFFEVGFQLSYSAVFGIVYLQPVLSRLLTVKNKLLNYFWMLLTVSVAAQIATVPFTLFYFSQFPTYFWISNLFVIPAVTILIPLGILLLILSGIPLVSTLISVAINHLIFLVYFLLQQIEQLPLSVLTRSVHPAEFAGLLFILISLYLLAGTHRIFYFKTILVTLFLLLIFQFAEQ